MAEVHRILKEMYIGMAVCMIVFLAIGAFFMRPYYIFALALVIVNSLLRMIVTLALLVGSIFLGITAFAGVALGMIEPKICAYLQPQMRKWLIRLGLEEPEEEHKDKN